MKYIILTLLLSFCFLYGCGPDLQVVGKQYETYNDYCSPDGKGNMIITIHNAGSDPAGASKTLVQFGSFSSYVLDTPPLEKGAYAILEPVLIPAECWSPDCSFIIKADMDNVIDETSEGNNEVFAVCIG